MEPELEKKLLEKIRLNSPDGMVISAESRFLREVNRRRLEGNPFYLKLINKYFDAKLYKNL